MHYKNYFTNFSLVVHLPTKQANEVSRQFVNFTIFITSKTFSNKGQKFVAKLILNAVAQHDRLQRQDLSLVTIGVREPTPRPVTRHHRRQGTSATTCHLSPSEAGNQRKTERRREADAEQLDPLKLDKGLVFLLLLRLVL
nr:uncharacterized protein LOC128686045 [Cherax quadricarinatus]